MDLSQYAELFLAESREHVGACNEWLLRWERDPAATEPVAGLFRAVHTIKGMAATMGYGVVAELAHGMENLLDRLRRDAAPPTPALLQTLFRATDALEATILQAARGAAPGPDARAMIAELDRATRDRGGGGGRARPGSAVPAEPAAADGAAASEGRLVTVGLRPDAPLKGGRALLVLQRVAVLGAVREVTPPVAAFAAEEFDGRFSFRLGTAATAEAIAAAVSAAGEVDSVLVSDADIRAAAPAAAGDAGRTRHLRVDLRRLDALMDLIGELVTARGRLNDLATRRRDPAIDDLAIQISRLSTDLQAEIIQARMTPVWQVFDRFPRVVRDMAHQLGKQVRLRVEGKEIELDRAILDELSDPLVHLLRNAVDHGIEAPEERRRRGKAPEGELLLAAVRERASVTITIGDDGGGIDRASILAKAKREGLVDPAVTELSDDQLLRVLARPGFTTAGAVTSVSGRGVGIDVAVTRLRALGGSLEVRSELGRGTVFELRLPVTLAIVRALIATVGAERYALPLTYVSETVELGAAPLTTVEGREAMLLRNRVVPIVHLRDLLGTVGDPPRPRRPVIVLERGGRRAGVVVDGMEGQREIVVKSFDAPQGTLPVFSGATIMGDGVPALILDAGGLL
jgi:two-component system chemotaxis sensor kinase CheA